MKNNNFEEKNRDILQDECSNDKFNNGTSNEYVFEMIRDFADPTKNYFPFLFYELIDKNKFDVYFCFMNVEAAGENI